MTEDKRHLRPGADGICGVAFLFCDQKRNQKSLGGKIKSVPPINARGTRATNFGTIAAGGQTASAAGRSSFVTKRGTRKVPEVRSGLCLLSMPAERGQPISEQSLRAVARHSRAGKKPPPRGTRPPAPPKRIKILDFTPKATTGRLLRRNPKFLFG